MTYQAFQAQSGKWEIYNIKTNRLVTTVDSKIEAVRLVSIYNTSKG